MSSSNPTKERIGENNLHFRRAEGYKQVVVDIEGTTEKAFFDFDEKTGKPKFAGNGKTNEKSSSIFFSLLNSFSKEEIASVFIFESSNSF